MRHAFIVLVGDLVQLVVDAVHVVDIAVIAHVLVVRSAVGVQHAEVVVECVILLQHEDDVADRVRAACRGYGHDYSGRVMPPAPLASAV